MKNILVSGSTTFEMTARVEGFPLPYTPIEFEFEGVRSEISGVGLNLTKSLLTLGNNVKFCTIIGRDLVGEMILNRYAADGIPVEGVLQCVAETAHSCILYNSSGKRKIILDLKDIQETRYPMLPNYELLCKLDLAYLNNINYSRAFFPELKEAGVPIATDVHVVGSLEDEYNLEFMRESDILFLSNEEIFGAEQQFMAELIRAFENKVIVIGMGEEGALLFDRSLDLVRHFPAVKTRPVVNSIGAGDSLCSSFLHYYLKTRDSQEALQNAVVYASWKIGVDGAAFGFVNEQELAGIRAQYLG